MDAYLPARSEGWVGLVAAEHRAAERLIPGVRVHVLPIAGVWNLLTQPVNSAFALFTVVVIFKGIASGQREVLSMMVNRWVTPLDAGSGPT